MKNTILRFAVLCLGFALILGGCSRNNNNSATPSPSPSASPESSVMPTETPETIASVQDLLDYFQTNNYTFNQVTLWKALPFSITIRFITFIALIRPMKKARKC